MLSLYTSTFVCSVLEDETDHLSECSYDAAEDNELTFREGDRIVEIEAASDEWWSLRLRVSI